MRPPFFKDWRFYSILAFFLGQCAFSIWGGFGFSKPRFGIIIAILWLIVTLFVWHKQIFAGRIRVITFSMFLAPFLFFVAISIIPNINNIHNLISYLCMEYYPVIYPIFNFLYGKLKRTHFNLFETFLLGVICTPILPTITIAYFVIILLIHVIFEIRT